MFDADAWIAYFENNGHAWPKLPWDLGPQLSDAEKTLLAASLAEFQVGEQSEGKHLLNYARRREERAGLPRYADAVKRLIAEEQRHARVLAQFLKLAGLPLKRTTILDRIFRSLRNVAGSLELSLCVLVTAELIAKLYYDAVRKAAPGSRLLDEICTQFLRDEDQHLVFQFQQLAWLREPSSPLRKFLAEGGHRFLLLAACVAVWPRHGKVLRAGGYTFPRFLAGCWWEFESAARWLRDHPRQLAPISA